MIEETAQVARAGGLTDGSVTSVRVVYPDLHGYPRGTDVPIGEFDHVAEQAFFMCGGLDDVDRKWAEIQKSLK